MLIYATMLSAVLLIYANYSSVAKTKQFRAMVSIDDQQEVLHGLFKEAILWPLGWPSATANLAPCPTANPVLHQWRWGLFVSTHRGDTFVVHDVCHVLLSSSPVTRVLINVTWGVKKKKKVSPTKLSTNPPLDNKPRPVPNSAFTRSTFAVWGNTYDMTLVRQHEARSIP